MNLPSVFLHSTGGDPPKNSVGSWTDDAITACFYSSTFANAADTCTHTHIHPYLKYQTLTPEQPHSSEHIYSLLFILTTLTLLFLLWNATATFLVHSNLYPQGPSRKQMSQSAGMSKEMFYRRSIYRGVSKG